MPRDEFGKIMFMCAQHGRVTPVAGYHQVACDTNAVDASNRPLSVVLSVWHKDGRCSVTSDSSQAYTTQLHRTLEVAYGCKLMYYVHEDVLAPARTTLQFHVMPFTALLACATGEVSSRWKALSPLRESMALAACMSLRGDRRVHRIMLRWIDHDTVVMVSTLKPLPGADIATDLLRDFFSEFRFQIMALRPESTAVPTLEVQ